MKILMRSLPAEVGHLRVRSTDGCIYTVEVLVDGQWYVLCDDRGTVLCYRSLQWVRRELGKLRAGKVTLLHQTAYQEMIGLPAAARDDMEVPISWTDPANGADQAGRNAGPR